ncbi:MAG TPA: aminoglycoside phosphotransferase family protein [Fibrobacteria bacterium]|nr:aminoglycoside phosphotransferase family protein [Fibrobacteria bacterium]
MHSPIPDLHRPPSRTHLASGANNDITLMECPDRKVVMKRARPSAPDRLATETRVLSLLAGGIAPALVDGTFLDASEGGSRLFMEHIEGEHRFELDVRSARLLGAALAAIHRTDLASLADFLEKPSWQDYFQDRLIPQLEEAREVAPSPQIRELQVFLERIRRLGQELDTRSLHGRSALVHTDIIPLNVIFQADRCRIIDWELARIDAPEWDLCSALKSFVFAPRARDALLDAYGTAPDPDRLRFVSLLHYANVALWRLCSFYRRGENQSIRAKFLRELDAEMDWIRNTLSRSSEPGLP